MQRARYTRLDVGLHLLFALQQRAIVRRAVSDLGSMPGQPHDSAELHSLLLDALRLVAEAPEGALRGAAGVVRSTLARVETETPGGAPLHAQLDNVRKWLDALDNPVAHERFGGAGHLRDYVVTQLRLATGALEDYQRAIQ